MNLQYLCEQIARKRQKTDIMRKKTTKGIIILTAALALAGCSKEKFHINGAITEAKDNTLYLENMSLDGPVIVDSIKLDESGSFEFSGERPEAPDFYRLRIGNQYISLSVDSTETITVKAKLPTLATDYTVEGSENCATIKEISLKNMALYNRVVDIQRNSPLGAEATRDSILRVIEAYKDVIRNDYIYKAPYKASSYFALFQTLGNQLIFNPRESKNDIKTFAAVATSWDTFYPEALRGKNLHNIALEGIKNDRFIESRLNSTIDMSKVNTSNTLDISLVSNKGKVVNLSSLKGKVVLLDFHAFVADGSTARIMQLREVYNKYHDRGLEIYQVSVDPDEHFWKQQTAALPWICVRDPEGIESRIPRTYNVHDIPTFFLLGRDNSPYKRDVQIKDLDAEIQSLL